MSTVFDPVESLLSPAFIEDPYPTFRAIRETDPVCFLAPFNAWIVTRFADVRTAFTDDRFCVRYEQHQVNRMGPQAVGQAYVEVGREFLVLNDPPSHTRLKKIFREPFTAKRVSGLVPYIEQIANECIDRFADDGSVDIVAEYAHRVPIAVMSHLLAVPEEYEPQIVAWISAFYAALFVTPMSDDELVAANGTARQARDFFVDIVRQRRARPGNDFLSDLIATNDAADEPLTDEQIAINAFLLYFAGHDTQKGQFSLLIDTLDRHRDLLAQLAADTSLIANAMPELYRYESTGQFMGRTAVEDIQLGGHLVAAGQTLMVSMTAANRDPDAFPDPDRLDLGRDVAHGTALRNMTFGTGRHHCLGAFLAQTNLPLMVRILLDRIGPYSIDRTTAVRLPTIEVRAWAQLPISWSR